jgi:NADH-quinone oxidoreductase subunit M
LVFLGSFQTWPWLTTIAVSSVVLTAAYMLWTLQRVYLGKVNEKYTNLPDISRREALCLLPLAVIVVILGVYPKPVLDLMIVSLNGINETLALHGAQVAGVLGL